MAKKKTSQIDGNHILYHFLQKDLFESDVWLFQMLSARLVASLGIWLHPDIYKRIPIILPFVVRDPSCRKRKEGEVEEWGTPNKFGFLRDDNSLIKGLPRSLTVCSTSQSLYHNKRIGNGFVASHVWRKIVGSQFDADLASRDPWLNSFVPNLVWLPSQVSKLSDREGTFTQLYLQALSAKIYKDIEVDPKIKPFVERAWSMLDVPKGIPLQGLPDLDNLSFFEPSERFFTERIHKINEVVKAIEIVIAGRPLIKKVITTRFGNGLPEVDRRHLVERFEGLDKYHKSLIT